MKIKTLAVVSVLSSTITFYSAFGLAPECQQIKAACETAGFIKGDVKDGKGLWIDCIDAIMGNPPKKAATIPVPAIDPKVVATCKQVNPSFGVPKK